MVDRSSTMLQKANNPHALPGINQNIQLLPNEDLHVAVANSMSSGVTSQEVENTTIAHIRKNDHPYPSFSEFLSCINEIYKDSAERCQDYGHKEYQDFLNYTANRQSSYGRLKRKRPAKTSPNTEKKSEASSGNGLSYGFSSMQGWRRTMEDAHCAYIGLPAGYKHWSFFGIFDGHGGSLVSEQCSQHLLATIMHSADFCVYGQCCNSLIRNEGIKNAIKSSFLELDERMKKLPAISWNVDRSGTTAACILISITHFHFINCGDSRVILSRDQKVFFATKDHKPSCLSEKQRILSAGGNVKDNRVNGHLGVSRSLGDYRYKKVSWKGLCEQFVSPEPDVDVFERNNELDEFLVLACDGIFNVVSNEELCNAIRKMMLVTSDLEYICNRLLDTCLSKGSKDNMSIIIIALSGAPKVSQDHADRDVEIDKILETLETKTKSKLVAKRRKVQVDETSQVEKNAIETTHISSPDSSGKELCAPFVSPQDICLPVTDNGACSSTNDCDIKECATADDSSHNLCSSSKDTVEDTETLPTNDCDIKSAISEQSPKAS